MTVPRSNLFYSLSRSNERYFHNYCQNRSHSTGFRACPNLIKNIIVKLPKLVQCLPSSAKLSPETPICAIDTDLKKFSTRAWEASLHWRVPFTLSKDFPRWLTLSWSPEIDVLPIGWGGEVPFGIKLALGENFQHFKMQRIADIPVRPPRAIVHRFSQRPFSPKP